MGSINIIKPLSLSSQECFFCATQSPTLTSSHSQVLEAKETELSSLNSLQENSETVKTFLAEVMTHGADLKFLTISGQKFIDISKVRQKNKFFSGLLTQMLGEAFVLVFTSIML